VRSALAELVRPSAFMIRATAVLITGSLASLVAMAGTASADQAARVEPNTITFGLLGPVGLAAVVLGIIGMTAGVVRQRRRTRATVPAGSPDDAGGQVTAMAEAVLAENPAPRS
jgi:lysylphosphatidylglycerol synthetase-like protein (DUF2156 family)